MVPPISLATKKQGSGLTPEPYFFHFTSAYLPLLTGILCGMTIKTAPIRHGAVAVCPKSSFFQYWQ
jgi:hypothetical protein